MNIVKLLLANRVGLNIIDKNGMTPLHWGIFLTCFDIHYSLKNFKFIKASMRGHLEIVKLLLKNGANPNNKGFGDQIALHKGVWILRVLVLIINILLIIIASWYGHLEIVKVLLDFGAKINSTDTNGKTALDIGIFNIYMQAFLISCFFFSISSKAPTRENCNRFKKL